MKQKELSVALKAISLLCALIVLVLGLVVLPSTLFHIFSEQVSAYWGGIVFLWITCIPVLTVLVLVWKIATQIGRNNSFSYKNAGHLRLICLLSLTDTLLYFFASVILLFLHSYHLLLLSVFIVCMGAAISVVSAVFSHLVQKGADMKAEQDLTI